MYTSTCTLALNQYVAVKSYMCLLKLHHSFSLSPFMLHTSSNDIIEEEEDILDIPLDHINVLSNGYRLILISR